MVGLLQKQSAHRSLDLTLIEIRLLRTQRINFMNYLSQPLRIFFGQRASRPDPRDGDGYRCREVRVGMARGVRFAGLGAAR
ncbi:hypothetical protein BSL82_09655 [Tardibacter chloracetimidivorans]|uniref:Uncharacterized protein n=1 Tax=Tardibacter chloracetimidivorans TaxID=1921510 RepID=A0A1L3ZV62_9SPHN|nr:hypothetical protein BSL82_09655 [Tardibacter chloracetimidivorans]